MNVAEHRTGGKWQALLLLAPVLVLAWTGPGWVLRNDVLPQATGVGFVALALLPAAAVLLFRRDPPSVRGLWFLLVPILVAVAWLASDRLTDTFEASRVLLQWIVALVCVLAGAVLSDLGRKVFVRGAVIASIALAGIGRLDAAHAFTGALGNTGSLSEAALAGAVAGGALAACGRGVWRIVGLVAGVVFLLYTAHVPVLAGSLSCAAGMLAVVLAMRGRARWFAAVVLAMALIAFLIPLAGRTAVPETEPSTATTQASDAPIPESKAIGFRVRLLIWQSSVPMSFAHPLAGVGTGQFRATFPAWRDPREIELTTHGRRIAEETEVEHPHNDWLVPWLEGGWAAGLAWTAFLLTVAWSAWKRLRLVATGAEVNFEAHDVALAAAALALLVNALVRGPLLQNPVSSVLAFVLFGTQLAREPVGPRKFARRVVAIGAVALLLVVTPRALAFVRHGRALQRLAEPNVQAPAIQRAVADAIAACPDSVPAHAWSARIAEARQDGNAVVLGEWHQVLGLRPQHIEAWIQVGNHLGATDPDSARAAYARVLDLDAHDPSALQNMGTLELNTGRPASGLAYFDRLPAHRAPSRAWLEALAARLALRGVDDSAEAVFARVDPALAGQTAEQCFALATAARKNNRPAQIGDAWEARAHLRWAREHAAAGHFADAVRSYRQALRLCTTHVPEPRRLLLELAAALWLAGKHDEARAQAGRLVATPEDLAALPEWAGAPLRSGFAEEKK